MSVGAAPGGRVQGKIAAVTGAGRGIGKATAIRLAEEGARVALLDINDEGITETVRLCNEAAGGNNDVAKYFNVDVSDEQSVANCFSSVIKHFGGLNILVNNAAEFILGNVEELTHADWDKSLNTNVKGYATCAKHAVSYMKEHGGGSIVHLNSISSFIAEKKFIAYATTKAAGLALTRNLALDYAKFNIRVNSVSPGTIETPATCGVYEAIGKSHEELLEIEGKKHMLGRIGQPREVANCILFLVSDEASFVTAANLMCDGGYTAL